MPEATSRPPSTTTAVRNGGHGFEDSSRGPPIMAPQHSWFTSPARSHAGGQGKELPLHLIQLILEYLDDPADLARVTRTSRLFYYMTLPRLYEQVTLTSHATIRYVDGKPTGYGSGSPFAMGLNTLISRSFTDYVHTFRVIGEWREHDVDDYAKGRVPDNTMVLQVAMRAAMDKMKNLKAFAWELNSKPLSTIYESLMHKSSLTSLTLRFPTRRIPRPCSVVPPLPNLVTLVCYDMDPLSSPDNISLIFLMSKKLENLMLHFHPRMRETGEESVQLSSLFGRCIAARYSMNIKRFALYNLYCRNQGDGFENVMDLTSLTEGTFINCMGTSDPLTVFLDNTWRLQKNQPVPNNMKVLRVDTIEQDHVKMLSRFDGLERLYIVSKQPSASKTNSAAQTPTSPSSATSPAAANGTIPNGATSNLLSVSTPSSRTEGECRSLAGDYLARIQSNHKTIRHLLLPEHWIMTDETLFKLAQSLPQLEQLGIAITIPAMEYLRRIVTLTPRLWALRMLVTPGTAVHQSLATIDMEMHKFALATELWRPEYKGLRYVGLGDKAFRLGGVAWPKGAPSAAGGGAGTPGQQGQQGDRLDLNTRDLASLMRGPMRVLEQVDPARLSWIEIWGLDTVEFSAKFP